jgi:hypothetical protein
LAALSEEEAIAQARAALKLDQTIPARAWHTRRLDRPARPYYLVIFGAEQAVGVAAVDATSGEIQAMARLPGSTSHPMLTAGQAMAVVTGDQPAVAQLVWQPCYASRSLLYPLWEVRAAGERVYVDQQGKVWRELSPGGPGGHPPAPTRHG